MKNLVETRNTRVTKLFQELKQELKQWEDKHGYALIKPSAYVDDSIGTYNSTKSLGNCYCHRLCNMNYSFHISVNKLLADNGTDKDIKDVLTHELIHTAYGCFNHSNTFKSKAQTVKYYLGYDGLKNQFDKKYTKDKGQRNIVYKCTECGKLFKRYRHFNTDKYYCPCHGKLELVS